MNRNRPTRYHAAWVVPIESPPIQEGFVDVAGGVIEALGTSASVPSDPGRRTVRLFDQAILPGLVNAHAHLELSELRGEIPPASSMPAWARDVMSKRESLETGNAVRALKIAAAELRRTGTSLVGDIANTRLSAEVLEKTSVDAVVFREEIGFNVMDDEARKIADRLCEEQRRWTGRHVRFAVAAHAPYSVSPSLFKALSRAAGDGLRSVHLAESKEEILFLEEGIGAWRSILSERGRWNPKWKPPAVGPVAYLSELGWIGPRTIVVHGVHLTDAELRFLAENGATLVICPRSNAWTGAGIPPIERIFSYGVRVAIGTDSLASVPDLNLFSELAEIRRIAPDLPASEILRSATQVGATALGAGDRLGAIVPSRKASLIAVDASGASKGIEESLVSGIEPEQITWLDDIDFGVDEIPSRRF